LIVRINGLETAWGEVDIAALAQSGADGILLPKVADSAMVHAVIARLDAAEGADTLAIWCMMETPPPRRASRLW
jgi:citrate lyase beta subunit